MSNFTSDQYKTLIQNFLQPRLLSSGFDKALITDDTDLLKIGILDSFGFIDLIMHIEIEAGISIDLSNLSSDTFTSINGLISEVLSQQN